MFALKRDKLINIQALRDDDDDDDDDDRHLLSALGSDPFKR
jgi:hypothetical protein